MGSLYRRKGQDGKPTGPYWIKYYVNGRPVRESTGCKKEQAAGRVLKAREVRAATGQPMLPRADRVRYEEAAADLREHYRTTGDRELEEAGWRFDHLAAFFGGRRLVDLSGELITRDIAARQEAGVANGTINRE